MEGRPGLFYHVNAIIACRQRGEESPIESTGLGPFLAVSVPNAGVLNVHKAKKNIVHSLMLVIYEIVYDKFCCHLLSVLSSYLHACSFNIK